MTVEFINNRIEGKQKEITKLEKKLERILKAQQSNWENNPYFYSERDLQYVSRDLENAKKSLEEYQQKLVAETEKANSRNIPAILEFLEQWKQRMMQFYKDSFDRYLVERDAYYKADHEYCEWYNYKRWDMHKENPEECKRIEKEHDTLRKEFRAKWNFIVPFVDSQYNGTCYDSCLNEAKVQKMLDTDADAKYDFIIERTNAIVGTITDASGLYIGKKGDLNGLIIGEKGTAKVETIGAGGYNIQCYHFRTLINRY